MQAKKYYGQNFINDPFLINRIVNLLEPQKNADSLVIEIGPGKGALTTVLTKYFKKVIAIEIDQDLIDLLKTKIETKNLEVIKADVLDIDWNDLIKKYRQPNQKVLLISNLPYYITSPILFSIYKKSNLFNQAVFMLQREVAERISATKNNKKYNNLSIVSQFYGDISLAFDVSKKFFQPQPKVDSSVIKIKFFPSLAINRAHSEDFTHFVRDLFNNRRKTILNNLSRVTHDKGLATEYLNLAKIDLSLRPENLELEDFISLFKVIKK